MKNFDISKTHIIAKASGIIIHIHGFTQKNKAVKLHVCTDMPNQHETIKLWALMKFGEKSKLEFTPVHCCKNDDITFI